MSIRDAEMAYRKTAVEGASSIGLTIALYDTLAGDLRRAADAMRAGNIELRCRELNHALIVLGYLESWVDLANGKELAGSLTGFYKYLRAKMMEGQLKQSAEIIDEQMKLVLEVRGSWQHLDQDGPIATSTPDIEMRDPAELHFTMRVPQDERVVSRWSA